MKCTVCGKEFEDGLEACPSCGTRKIEMGIKATENTAEKAEKKDAPRLNGYTPDFNKFSGGVTVKEKKASLIAGMDLKLFSLILLIVMVVIFIAVKVYYDRKTAISYFKGFSVELPVSLKEETNDIFAVDVYDSCRAYSNGSMEFVIIEYDVFTLYPQALNKGETGDFETYSNYLDANSAIKDLDRQILSDMNDAFELELVRYKLGDKVNNRMSFTYNDEKSYDNYAEVRTFLHNDKLLVFVCTCSENIKGRMSDTFDNIFSSIELE